MGRRSFFVLRLGLLSSLLLTLSLLLTACSLDRKAVEPTWLTLVTTQELQDSGLLDVLLPPYEQANNVRVKRLPVTTAMGLDYASKAGVDVLLLPGGPALDALGGPAPTYPPYQRDLFPTPTAYTGPGPIPTPLPGKLYNERRLALWTELVGLGPADNTSDLTTQVDAASYLRALVLSGQLFYVPAPDQEPALFATLQGVWGLKGIYTAADRGPNNRLIEADVETVVKKAAQDKAFTVAPLATFLKLQSDPAVKGKLKVTFQIDKTFFEPYDVLVPNNTPDTDRNVALARTLADYLTGQQAQGLIDKYIPTGTDRPIYRPAYYPVYVPKI
ncbi:MAG: hypothetical protein J0I20_34735 [Chloroflexi bacterium]|nr:hypothetical protein [Chloroflexota bacterium]OJV89752.1 MAG: hypothetical protein BGO39_28835 [Chloroflexi bacterium 54-19]